MKLAIAIKSNGRKQIFIARHAGRKNYGLIEAVEIITLVNPTYAPNVVDRAISQITHPLTLIGKTDNEWKCLKL